MSISNSFMTFAKGALEQQKAWEELVEKLYDISKLDKKTEALAYLAVLAYTRFESGILFHVKQTKELGASREEIISSILVGFSVVGNIFIEALPIALSAFDE